MILQTIGMSAYPYKPERPATTYIAKLVLGPLLSFEPDMEFELSPGKLAALGSVELAATRVANINPGALIWPVLMV